MTTLYQNFASGYITDTPLYSTVTSVNSSTFINLPLVVAPDIMWIILDPLSVNGNPEIVKVTAHSSNSTIITVVRGQQNTTARQHENKTAWINSITKSDLDDIIARLTILEG